MSPVPDAAMAEASQNDWIKHSGGGCPVADDVLVEARDRSGTVDKDYAGEFGILWHDDGFMFDVVEYRLVQS